MNCHDVRARLDNPDCAAAGVLAPELRIHIEACADCARYRQRVAAIIDPRSVLRGEIPPPRDLWPAIASQIKSIEKRKFWNVPRFLPLAAAAGLAAILVASWFSLSLHRSETVASISPQAPEIDPTLALALLPGETVELGFVQTRAILMKLFDAQKSSAAPERVAMLERTLSTMDSAAQDIRAALERDPYNQSLLLRLSHIRRRELRLLQQVVL